MSGNRMQIGMLFLLLTQIILLAASWLAWLGVINPHSYLPLLDRTLALFSLVLIIWLWTFPEDHKVWDALVALVEVVILLFGVTGMVLWLRIGSNTPFNTSSIGGYASYTGLSLVVIGLILVLWRRPGLWGYGLITMLVLLAGYLAQYLITQPAADFGWYIHLGEMIAFLFLLLLPKRLVSNATQSQAQIVPGRDIRTQLNGKVIASIANILTESSPQKFYEEMTSLVTQLMDADICLLIIPPKAGEQLIIPVGYNASQNMVIEGKTVDGHLLPAILHALKAGMTLELSSQDDPDARKFSVDLGLSKPSNLLLVPFHPKGTSAMMGIAVLSKPNMPDWSKDDSLRLMEITEALLSNGGRSQGAGGLVDQGDLLDKLHREEAHTDQVRLEYAQLKAKYDSLVMQTKDLDSQHENEKALEEEISRLERRNRELENMLARGRPSMEEVDQLRQELRIALTDLARIPTTLSKSDQKMLETQLSAMKSLDKLQPTELVTGLAQEFRQPLAAIIGYTDLLLGESVGLLGAVQRKFLERVKASTERMGILVNELVEVVTIDGGQVDRTPMSVALEPVIREAVGNITAQLNEKNIAIHLDLPEVLPAIEANKDAILQILSNLLENACLVTPENGSIMLVTRVEQRDEEQNFVLLSVSDQGGGIDQADIPRVFTRRYKLENPIIKGLGDTGIGMSIVKSLVELLRGRVWVDSQPGGSTFSVLLPLSEGQPKLVHTQVTPTDGA